MSNAYRAEVDGLRAVAVVPVILFHAGLPAFSGGYVGVDVFFVISGYLITSILLKELNAGEFSFLRFYERRARRLLPALFFVMTICIPLAWLSMTPGQLTDFARSLVAVTTFASNVLFWLEGGYFAPAVEVKPLLHTWSLAVEEQFYIAFPILMIVLWRFGRHTLFWCIACFALVSLALAQWGANISPAVLRNEQPLAWTATPGWAYFLAPARAWELLLGSLLAMSPPLEHARPLSRSIQDALAVTGLLMIGWSVVNFDQGTPYPSLWTLVPTVGTVLVLRFSTTGTSTARLLAMRPLVAMGLISYSAYLWHQPLFAFARLNSFEEPSPPVMSALATLTLILAWGTWRFVEQPFRTAALVSRERLIASAMTVAVAMVGIGLTGHFAKGFSDRFEHELRGFQKVRAGDSSGCSNAHLSSTGAHASTGTRYCSLGAEGKRPTFAVIGDSHAASLTDAMVEFAKQQDLAFVPINDNWCAPLYDFGADGHDRNPACRALMARAIDMIAADDQIDTVILVAEWANYTTGVRWGVRRVARYSDSDTDPAGKESNTEVFRRALLRTLARLNTKRVIIVKSVPEYSVRVPETIAKAALMADGELPEGLRVSLDQYAARNAEVETVWRGLQSEKVTFVESGRTFCPSASRWCRYRDEKGSLYFDDNHLSYRGAQYLIADAQSLLVRAIKQPEYSNCTGRCTDPPR